MTQSSARSDIMRSAVLAQVGALGPTSRASLARLLSVSPALVTQITKQLIADGLLVELDHSPSQGGRPARLLGLVADAGRVIGVKVAADHVTVVEVGIDGTVVR
ncbi:XylR family transcriptional regulator, partial [Microbacterium sp. AGC62]